MSLSKHEARASLLADSSSMGRDPSPYYEPYAGGYHEREGMYAPTGSREARPSWCYTPDSKWTLAFCGICIVQAIVALALQAYVFARFQLALQPGATRFPIAKTVPTYLSLFIFGFVYQLVLVYDALRLKNTIQLIGLCLYNVGLLIEAAVQNDQINDAIGNSDTNDPLIQPSFFTMIRPYIIALPCVIALGTACMALVTWKLNDEFSWSIYKNISADLRLKRRYLTYQIYIALLKFDFFFFLAFTVQFVVVVVRKSDVEFYLTIAAIPVTIILLFLAAYWTRKESVFGMCLIIIVYFGAMAYFFFKLVRMYNGPPELVANYRPAKHSLTTFAIITIVLLLVTIVYAIMCTINFNSGLKPHLQSRVSRRRRGTSVDASHLFGNDLPLGASGPSRMTID